jgi:23S rRNA pseudouridine1911/1915/1917 synthase
MSSDNKNIEPNEISQANLIAVEPELNNHPDRIDHVVEIKVAPGQRAERLDAFLTHEIKNATRTKVQLAIDAERVTVNGKVEKKASRKVQGGDYIVCVIKKLPPIELIPQDIPLSIAFEDEHLLVVDKPAGMVTHPGVGNRYGTLVNAVIYHLGIRNAIKIEYDEEDENPDPGIIYASDEIRPGIVHRLDKDTSGLLLIAKSPEIHVELQKQFYDRTISREYNTLAWGKLKQSEGIIEGDIGRSPYDRKKFAVVKKNGKHAITDYWVLEEFDFASLIKLKLRTGRTHQIRVHLSHNGHPVIGDATYNGDKYNTGSFNPLVKKKITDILKIANRQMLHARQLTFRHPISNKTIVTQAPLPPDFKEVMELLRE